MAVAKLAQISRQFVRVPITAVGVDAPTLRSLPVHFAFMPDGATQPTPGEWVLGSWEPAGSPVKARCLVGPGGTVELDPLDWFVWVWVQGAQEEPREPAGKIRIY